MTPEHLRTAKDVINQINRSLLDLEVALDNSAHLLPAGRIAKAREQLGAAADDLAHARRTLLAQRTKAAFDASVKEYAENFGGLAPW